MPALISVDNTLGALLIGTVLSSIVYGVTWLQVYSYYSTHSSRDRWPIKCFVAFLMVVDTVNVAFIMHANYVLGVTDFGDYRTNLYRPWSLPAIALSGFLLEVLVEHYYAYRIYRLSRGSLYLPAAISAVSLTSFAIGIMFSAKSLASLHVPDKHFEGYCIATLACKVLCNILITSGMVHYLLSKRTHVGRTNNVLNLLAIYAINCGALNLVFAVSCLALLAKYPNVLLYLPSFFMMIRLYFCAFMSILNSRDYLRETFDGPDSAGTTLAQLKVRMRTTLPCAVQVTTETSTNAAVPKSLPPVDDASFTDSVLVFDREKYPMAPVPGVLPV